jgi:phospholipase/lecithinase/hemolysin
MFVDADRSAPYAGPQHHLQAHDMSKWFSGIALVVGLLGLAGPAGATPFSSVVVFGDSNVDNGNLAALGAQFGVTINPPPDFGGRNNNGLVVVEYLAQRLGIPLVDLAFSGATTAADLGFGLIPGTLTQINNYLGTNGQADPSALYIYWAGSNDLLDLVNNTTLPTAQIPGAIATAIGNINTGLQDLVDAGATKILVANRTPRDDLTSQDNLNGIAFNSALAADLSALPFSADVDLFDDYDLIADMITNPAKYGFVHTLPTDQCIDIPSCADDLTVASQYVFWDDAHKTTAVHSLLADDIIAQLPEPGTAVLIMPALLGLMVVRRRRALRK